MPVAEQRRALAADFFERPVCDVARDLIGCTVEHAGARGLIVETEAYHESEPACHAYIGRTPRNEPLFGPAGHVYVYLSYGIHDMLNLVTGPEGEGAAVLIRALQPVDGLDLMRARRGVDSLGELCSGPGKLARALAVGAELNARPLADGPLSVRGRAGDWHVVSGERVGITKAADLPWRFAAVGSRYVSRPRLG